jgi:hypothetical protein
VRYVKGFFAFWYDFIVGDAWEVAAGVVVFLLALYFGLHYASSGLDGYAAVLLPVAVMALLSYSLWRASKTG